MEDSEGSQCDRSIYIFSDHSNNFQPANKRNSQSLSVLSPPESQSDQSGSLECGANNVVHKHLGEVEKALYKESSHVNE